jgi:hypothetical protein
MAPITDETLDRLDLQEVAETRVQLNHERKATPTIEMTCLWLEYESVGIVLLPEDTLFAM